MRGDDAYAVLGLWPGAGRAEIDQAYRRLIKRYHPDYAGGDANRAAEINRAYSMLRAAVRAAPSGPPPAAAMQRQPQARSQPRSPGVIFGFAAVAMALLLAWSAAPMDSASSWSQFATPATPAAVPEDLPIAASDDMLSLEQPLAKALIDSSVDDAIRLHADGDPAQAAQFSRDCLRRLAANPSVQLFDSCAAYDESIAILGVDNPAFESGPFNPSAVTARQVGAARLLSADYFEAESRLQQIRSRVHMNLLPRIPDVRRAIEERAPEIPPPPKIAEAPSVTSAVPVRAEPRTTVFGVSIARPAPQPVRRATVERRQAPPPRQGVLPPAQRTPSPRVQNAAPPPPPEEARPAPAWQKPIRPAWQRPLAPAKDE